jgi:tetratricopeptide (TPR) repeat protein
MAMESTRPQPRIATLGPGLAFLLAGAVPGVRADPSTDRAIALYKSNDFSGARRILEKAVAADPANAAACYYLGMTLAEGGDAHSLEAGVSWLAKAVSLAPDNETYLADYGGNSLELADRKRSLDYAMRGRNAMEKAIRLNPADLDAREGLMRFYAQAPWPFGSAAKAMDQAVAIAGRDRARGLEAMLLLGRIHEKDRSASAARAAFAAALAIDPGNRQAQQALARLR